MVKEVKRISLMKIKSLSCGYFFYFLKTKIGPLNK